MKPIFAAVPPLLATIVTLSGCASSLSGLGGNESLSCKAPEGVICTSVSGVYANAATIASRTAPTPVTRTSLPAPGSYGANSIAPGQDKTASTPGNVVRSSPRVLRLWIAPWEDGDGDLHEESTVHVLVDNGRWMVDHVRATPRSRLDAVAPPLSATGEKTAPKPAAETPARSEALPMPGGIAPAMNLNALPR